MTLFLYLMTKTILQNLCKNIDYFLHFKKIEINLQNELKVNNQNIYLFNIYH